MSDTVETLTARLLAAAKDAGASAADAVAVQSSSIGVETRQSSLEHAERSESIEYGLRVFMGASQAIVSGSDMTSGTLALMAERAVAMAKEAPEDPYCGLAEPEQLATELDASGLELAHLTHEPSPDILQGDALAAEAAAFAHDGIKQVEPASAGYARSVLHLAASNGFSGGYTRTSRWISCTAIAGEGLGMERDSDHDSRIFQSDLRAPEEIGSVAARRALERLHPRKPPTGHYPVLFDERVSSSLVGHLLGAANGAAVARGASWLRDKLGTQVLPEGLDIFEDPHRVRVAGSRPFDSEGLPTQSRKIVDGGVLTGWTLDLSTARKLGLSSTGNAARGVSSSPHPSNWNIALTQGKRSKDDLIRDMGTGLLVTSMIGSTINPNTGDYSRGAQGFWIENGQVQYPVNECTIAGNLLEMLASIITANDARPWLSRTVPSCLVEGMTLAGS